MGMVLFLAGYAVGALVGLGACLRWGCRRRNREMQNIDQNARCVKEEQKSRGHGE